MSVNDSRYAEIAQRHGVRLDEVAPPTPQQRLMALELCLRDQDVPFPISASSAASYLTLASNGQPFRIGTLSAQTVDLGQYANVQQYDRYTFEEHLSWACLIADQQRSKHRFACREYLQGEKLFHIGGSVIPDFYLLNARIYQQTGWQLATVNMIIPAELFFTCHSLRFFPVTTFMRPLEQDYLQEPDIGHDVAGHVATFTIPVVADLMQNHGIARNMIYQERDEALARCRSEIDQRKALLRSEELLLYAERIYWFTVEFGLVLQDHEIRGYGAGILSSPGETQYSIESPRPTRILVDPSTSRDLLRLATTDYLISEYQKTYFVIRQFDLLRSITPERIVAVAKQAVKLPHFSWRDLLPGDHVLQVGESAVSTNEKYLRLRCESPCDQCLTRTAIRNLRLLARGAEPQRELTELFGTTIPPLPEGLVQWFRETDTRSPFPHAIRPLSFEVPIS